MTLQYESVEDIVINQPDLIKFVNLEAKIPPISSLKLADIQEIIQASNLPLHVPTEGKFVTDFKIRGTTQTIARPISLLVIFDKNQDKFNIQVRSGKEVLETPTKKLQELYNTEKISLE
jgi:hypothetical protein